MADPVMKTCPAAPKAGPTGPVQSSSLTETDDSAAGPKAVTQLPDRGTAPSHERRILQALRRISRALELHSRELSAEHKITWPQLVCLLAVKEKGPLSTTAIAYEVHLSSSTVVGILDRLEEKGLVQRERGLRDRRLVNAKITEKGRRLAESAPSPLQETLAVALARLPELEQLTIALSLERVGDLMKPRETEADHTDGTTSADQGAGSSLPEAKEET